ncbi:hypothetical protein BDU57DRAFT_516411 [Ampelomyces quisqualis]|uniref:Uncharacterized protein n=1 Tax=Ampelomyces quisqualis TaxID=50730 RepID=A0A6A5QLY0_AMPQU|nr:hypothetical protein BDU57DRAFT_516411 [Ampelomyces quisqualis]
MHVTGLHMTCAQDSTTKTLPWPLSSRAEPLDAAGLCTPYLINYASAGRASLPAVRGSGSTIYPPSARQSWMPPPLARPSAQCKVPVSESTLRLIACTHIVASIGVMDQQYTCSCILMRSTAGQRIAQTHDSHWRRSAQILHHWNRDLPGSPTPVLFISCRSPIQPPHTHCFPH